MHATRANTTNPHFETNPEPMRRPDLRAKRWSKPRGKPVRHRRDRRMDVLNWLSENA